MGYTVLYLDFSKRLVGKVAVKLFAGGEDMGAR
jgi:hypothetical protein